MSLSVKRKRFLALTAGFITLLLYWLPWPWPFAELRGRFVSRIDVGTGNYKLLVIGLPPPWRQEYARLLRQRYDIRVQTEALCIVSESLVSYVESYNAVSTAAAIGKVGHDPFQECYEDARKDERNGEKRRDWRPQLRGSP